ncbi:hypothetical protein DL771_000888 [Monosporascus sp. 5C6A]|nr:hypothetical protein DL771_000888 [Monosporascus sp. 5C6A]
MSIENLKTYDPFAEADEDTGQSKQAQNYIHIRIQRMSIPSSLPSNRRHPPDPSAVDQISTRIIYASADYLLPERNGRKTLTTVQGLPKKFDQRKILKVIKKKFACNGTTVHDSEMGEVIQLQGDQRKDVHDFLIDKVDGLELDPKTIKVHGF